jgi:hypothetical protein
MFRLLQLRYHPDYSGDEFDYVFDIWLDGRLARRDAEKAAARGRMLALLRERDELADQRSHLPLTERTAVTERISLIAREIAAMLGPARKPPLHGAEWA